MRETHGLHKHNPIQSYLRWYTKDCQIVDDKLLLTDGIPSHWQRCAKRGAAQASTQAPPHTWFCGNHGTDGVTQPTAAATQMKECAPGRNACTVPACCCDSSLEICVNASVVGLNRANSYFLLTLT